MQLSFNSTPAPSTALEDRPKPVATQTAPLTPVPADETRARRFPVVCNKGWVRKLHAVVGLVASLNLLLLLTTGFLLQHREAFGLDERFISRSLLPESYRAQDGAGGVRADIVVTDLHSGRLLGSTGMLILDGFTLVWFVLLLSGVYLFLLGRWQKENRNTRNGNGVH